MPLSPPTTPEYAVGNDAAILVGPRDETRLNNKVELHDGRDLIKRTTFQAPGYAEELSYGLLSGTAKFSGYLPLNRDIVSAQMATFLGKNRKSKHLMIGPSGLKTGYEAIFCDTKADAYDVDTTYGGITTAATGFATTESGLVDGFCLHSPHAGSSGGNEVVNLVFTSVDPNQYLGLRGFGVTGLTADKLFSFRLADYATDALLCAAIKVGLEALTVYAGRTVTVTVTTPRGGTTTLSLLLRLEWSGGVNVVNPEAIQGGVTGLGVVNGDTGNYTFNGGATFQLGLTAATLQANQRTLGGAHAGVVVTGQSTAATAAAITTKLATPFPAPAQGSLARAAGALGDNGRLYLLAGYSNTADILEYDPVANTTVCKAAKGPDGTRQLAAGVALNGKIYVFGGEWYGVSKTSIWEYNYTSDTIATKAAVLPINQSTTSIHKSCVAVGTKIYILAATLTAGGTSTGILAYDPATDTMTVKSAVLPQPCPGATAATIGGIVYLFGGVVGATGVTAIYAYNPVADTIAIKTAVLPSGAQGMSACVIGTKIYLFGGLDATNAYLSRVLCYDTATDTITTLPTVLPNPLAYAVSASSGGGALLMGGEAAPGGGKSAILRFDLPLAGSAAFTSYYPLSAVPTAPSATGTGATTAFPSIPGTATNSLVPVVIQEGGALGLSYNLITASGQDAWVNFGSGTTRVEALLSILSLTGTGATLSVRVDHADDAGGVPGAATEAFSFDLQNNTALTYAVQLLRAQATTLKAWRRCRYILSGTNAQAVFAVAVAA